MTYIIDLMANLQKTLSPSRLKLDKRHKIMRNFKFHKLKCLPSRLGGNVNYTKWRLIRLLCTKTLLNRLVQQSNFETRPLSLGSCVRMISGLVGVYLMMYLGGSQMLLEGRVKLKGYM